jgi:hypothetical protein
MDYTETSVTRGNALCEHTSVKFVNAVHTSVKFVNALHISTNRGRIPY